MKKDLKDLFWIEDKKHFKLINITFLSSIFLILLVHYLFSDVTMLFSLKKLFDIEHYYDIAMNGYTNNYQYAFFPLLPLIIKGFSLIGIPILGVVVLNNILCLLSSYLIYNLSVKEYGISRKRALILSIMWLFSPVRVFLLVPYTEALFMFLSIITFALYKKRTKPILTGALLGLSVATRNVGSILFFVMFSFYVYDLIKNNDKINIIKHILSVYIPATIISCLYPIYLQIKLGNWKYFLDVQMECWSREAGNLFKVITYDINLFQTTNSSVVTSTIFLTYLSLAMAIYLMIHSIKTEKFKKLDLILITLLGLISIFSTYRNNGIDAGTCSFFRYIWGLFPMYLFINDKTSKAVIVSISIIYILVLSVVSTYFLSNIFLA